MKFNVWDQAGCIYFRRVGEDHSPDFLMGEVEIEVKPPATKPVRMERTKVYHQQKFSPVAKEVTFILPADADNISVKFDTLIGYPDFHEVKEE